MSADGAKGGSRAAEVRYAGPGGERRGLWTPGAAAGDESTAVLVVPRETGIGAFEREASERLAGAGHGVLVPLPPEDGAPCSDRRLLAELEAALGALAKRTGGEDERLAVLGADGGGTAAFLFGCHSVRLSAAVCVSAPLVYDALDAARPMQPLEMALNLTCPLLALYAEDDARMPRGERDRLEQVLSQFARDFDIVTFFGRRGVLLDPDDVDHDPRVADDAWDRILTFLSAPDT